MSDRMGVGAAGRAAAVTAATMAVFAAVFAAACTDGGNPPTPSAGELPTLIASSTFTGAAVSGSSGGSGTAVVFVSLPPGAVAGGNLATVSDPAAQSSVSAFMLDGGFDPVPISARDGDTLYVTITRGSHLTPVTGTLIVAHGRRPRVVRTSPAAGRTDVPMNARIIIVFSSPMDSTSLEGAIRLTSNGVAVPGTITIPANDGNILRAIFTPTNPLAPRTTYELDVAATASDRGGLALDSSVTSGFTTGISPSALAITGTSGTFGDQVAADFVSIRFHVTPSGSPLTTLDVSLDGVGATEGRWNLSATGYVGGDFRYNPISQLGAGPHSIVLVVTDSAGHTASSGSYGFTVVAGDPAPRIVVDSFYVLEIFDSLPALYEYAPKLLVHDTVGTSGLVIDGFEMLAIPGIPSPFPGAIAQGLVATTAATPLFKELYGDFDAAFMAQDGHRATGNSATARLAYHDAAGHFYSVTLTAPIIPGNWPTSYTGGCGNWSGWGIAWDGPCGGAVYSRLMLRTR